MNQNNGVLKFVTHSRTVLRIAKKYGWLPGARYSNLRDVRGVERLGFLDIEWIDYDFAKHVLAARLTRPIVTVAQDVVRTKLLNRIVEQAHVLSEYAEYVVIVPKDASFDGEMIRTIPEKFLLGFSVPTKYGKTSLAPSTFGKRAVHLLGGRPDVQRSLATTMNVVSLDCNRFTLDAAYGDFFDGIRFRPHPIGGYDQCVRDSLKNINRIWKSYT